MGRRTSVILPSSASLVSVGPIVASKLAQIGHWKSSHTATTGLLAVVLKGTPHALALSAPSAVAGIFASATMEPALLLLLLFFCEPQ